MCDEANVTGVIKSFEEPVDLKGAVKTQRKCIYLMTLLCTFCAGQHTVSVSRLESSIIFNIQHDAP